MYRVDVKSLETRFCIRLIGVYTMDFEVRSDLAKLFGFENYILYDKQTKR